VTDSIFDLSALFAPPERDAHWMSCADPRWPFASTPTRTAAFRPRLSWHTPTSASGAPPRACHADRHFYTLDADDDLELPDGFEYVALRALYAPLGDSLWYAAGRAVQLVEWARTHKFCGRCGAPTDTRAGRAGDGMRGGAGCSNIREWHRPVIMIVHRGDEMLLAQGARFPMKVYSALAGFVEPGESLEQAVRREVTRRGRRHGWARSTTSTASRGRSPTR
jgi:hypothetical protein